jgi:hypothetical protein
MECGSHPDGKQEAPFLEGRGLLEPCNAEDERPCSSVAALEGNDPPCAQEEKPTPSRQEEPLLDEVPEPLDREIAGAPDAPEPMTPKVALPSPSDELEIEAASAAPEVDAREQGEIAAASDADKTGVEPVPSAYGADELAPVEEPTEVESVAPQVSKMTDKAPAVRGDLVSGNRLLETLSQFIAVKENSEASTGGIVVAAPHHAGSGTPLSSGHDVFTGTVAERLARGLGAKCVIASELRTFVDLNKNPNDSDHQVAGHHLGQKAFSQAARRLKLYYQSQVFVSSPSLVIEIHGHSRGIFDFEISTGFQLQESVSQDKALITALKAYKQSLMKSLSKSAAFHKRLPTVGVYPLDLQVKFAATGTYTFNKIEKLRELGINIAGLHIELGRDLRPDPAKEKSEAFYDELIGCLTVATQAFVKKLSRPVYFDFKDHIFDELKSGLVKVEVLGDRRFVLRRISKGLLGRRIAVFCQKDMDGLGIAEGQEILLSTDVRFQDAVGLLATPEAGIPTGVIGIAKKYRDKLDLEQGEEVYVGKHLQEEKEVLIWGYVAEIADSAPIDFVEVGELLAGDLHGREAFASGITLNSATGENRAVTIEAKYLPHGKAVGLSTALAQELNVTFGDLVCFSNGRPPTGGFPNKDPHGF